jgi:hypothetical protein
VFPALSKISIAEGEQLFTNRGLKIGGVKFVSGNPNVPGSIEANNRLVGKGKSVKNRTRILDSLKAMFERSDG